MTQYIQAIIVPYNFIPYLSSSYSMHETYRVRQKIFFQNATNDNIICYLKSFVVSSSMPVSALKDIFRPLVSVFRRDVPIPSLSTNFVERFAFCSDSLLVNTSLFSVIPILSQK